MIEGRIEIHGLRCAGPARPGGAPRTFLVDVLLDADLGPAIASDDLAQTIDIAEVAATVRATIATRVDAPPARIAADARRALLERFGEARDARLRVVEAAPRKGL